MTAKHSLMVVHAHPDDEVFSTGGILAKYGEAGYRVVVVYCTRGEVGEIHDPELDADDAAHRLGEIRETEVERALHILGVTDFRFLGYRDSGMADTEHNRDPDAFMNAPLEEATTRLLSVMRETRPQVVITYDESGGYGHPDHVMCNRVTVEAFKRAQGEPWAPQKLYYSARAREAFKHEVEVLKENGLTIPWLSDDFDFDDYGTPASQLTAHIDISRYMGRKQKALAEHRTQIPGEFYYLTIPQELLAQAAGTEYFLRIMPPSGPEEYEVDLFDEIPDLDESPAETASPRR